MTPVVSVIVPAFNAAPYVAAALRSLLRETGVDLDIIVVDDGSTDGTAAAAAIETTGRHTIRVLTQPNRGVAAARNRGVGAVRRESRYLTFLDADDHNFPGRIRRQLDRLEANGGRGVVIGTCRFFVAIDEETSEIVPGSRTAEVLGTMLPASLFDRATFEAIGPFAEDLPAAEDVDFFLRLLERNVPFVTESEPAMLYRRHDTNLTNDVGLIRRSIADALRRSLARRRKAGGSMAIGTLFQSRSTAEEAFRNG